MALQFFPNPFIFAVVVTVAVGVIVYEIINNRRQVPARGHGGRPPPTPPPSPPPPHPRNNNRAKENASNIRERKPELRNTKNEDTRTSLDDRNISGENKALSDKIRNSDYNTKNYEKNVLGKIKNDIENINKNSEDESKLEKNISAENSLSSLNNLNVQSVEFKSANATVQQQPSSGVRGNINNDRESNQNVSASPSDFVINDYKKAVLDKIRSDAAHSKQSFCKACDNEVADTVFNPCSHCYLCLKCAESIFQIYGKCSTCHRDIMSLERIESAII